MAKEKITHLQAMGADVLTTRSDVEKGHPECEERRRVCARARACFCCSVRGQARLHYTHTPNPPTSMSRAFAAPKSSISSALVRVV